MNKKWELLTDIIMNCSSIFVLWNEYKEEKKLELVVFGVRFWTDLSMNTE